MVGFLKRDPVSKAKKYIEKALNELQSNYPDYASQEYEHAARLFLEAEEIDFAVKYFRESANCALQSEDHVRAGDIKTTAAEALVADGRFQEAGSMYSEASDHYHHDRKGGESARALSTAVLCYLAARSFETAVNLLRKAEGRLTGSSEERNPALNLAAIAVAILCEGEGVTRKELQKAVDQFKGKPSESTLLDFIVSSLKLALDTNVVVEWAGRKEDTVLVKTPIEFEVKYRCPASVRVVDYRVSLSSNLVMSKMPKIAGNVATEDSWLMEVTPILDGGGVVGPIKMRLEGDKVLVNRQSNTIRFGVSPAPPLLELSLNPQQLSCSVGDEVVIDVVLKNSGHGAASNITVTTELSAGLQLSLGNDQKSIQFLATGEEMRFLLYVKAVGRGDGLVTIKTKEPTQEKETAKTALVRVA
ncbi:MAG: hypothetical protein C4K47_05450 [Candidatus Thorarchaeota archaeon]|nr:MAG: hypothetical protein C4K47_05450 [Candidatus Thorarchaeota archaeon]